MSRPSRIKTTKDAYDDGFSVGSDRSGMSAGGWPYQSDFDKRDAFVDAWLRGFSDGQKTPRGMPLWATNPPKRKTMKRRKYKRTARRGGRVMTVTTSSRVVKTTRMNPHGISLAPYTREFPIDRGRYRVSISSSHSTKNIRKIMRELFPSWTKEQHAERYFRLWRELHYAKGLWGRFADRASQETFGRKFGFADYKVSGIGRDEYPARMKTRLRAAARAEGVIHAAIHAHEIMAGQTVLKRMAKKYPIGHDWRTNPRPSKTHIEFVIQGNYGYGWDDENTELTREDAKRSLREYRENGQGSYRLIRRRVKNDATNPGDEDSRAYARRRAAETRRSYLISNMGHVMVADAKNMRLAREELGGIAAIVKPSKSNPHDPRTADTVRIPAVIRASIPAGNGSDPRRAETRRLRVVRVAAARSNPARLALRLSRATWRRLPKGDRRARGSVRFVRCKTSKRGAAHWLRCVVR